MNFLDLNQFSALLKEAKVKPRLKQELRFILSTKGMTEEDWRESELVHIHTRSSNNGVLLIAPDEDIFLLPYELSRSIVSQTGRSQPIICDFCKTWQTGSRAGSISFKKDERSLNSITFLCCADLRCSDHVRSKTEASHTSRAQLHEDLTDQQRVERLRMRLRQLISDLYLQPLS